MVNVFGPCPCPVEKKKGAFLENSVLPVLPFQGHYYCLIQQNRLATKEEKIVTLLRLNTIMKLVGLLQELGHIIMCNPQFAHPVHSFIKYLSRLQRIPGTVDAAMGKQAMGANRLPCSLHSAENGRLTITQVNKITSDTIEGFEKNRTQWWEVTGPQGT